MRTFLILLGAALLLGTGAAAADLKISNRVPNSDEVGYRPADGATVPLNPPSFIWLHEKDAASYAIQ